MFQVRGSSTNSSLKSPMVPAVKVMATSECLVSVLSTASEKWSLFFPPAETAVCFSALEPRLGHVTHCGHRDISRHSGSGWAWDSTPGCSRDAENSCERAWASHWRLRATGGRDVNEDLLLHLAPSWPQSRREPADINCPSQARGTTQPPRSIVN